MLKDMYYLIKHWIQRDKGICPKCGNNAFEHGFFPRNDFYCTKCGLWEPNWEEMKRQAEKYKKEMGLE